MILDSFVSKVLLQAYLVRLHTYQVILRVGILTAHDVFLCIVLLRDEISPYGSYTNKTPDDCTRSEYVHSYVFEFKYNL